VRRVLGLAAFALLAGCGGQPEDTGAVGAGPNSALQAALPSATSASPAGVACEAAETTIFACTLENGKALSVCSQGGDTATYRYGGSPPELVIQGGRWARVGYSGGGELQIAFDNGETRYIVFSRTVRTRFDGYGNEPAFSDGVIVLRNGRFADMQLCRADSDASDYSEASEAAMQRLPQSEELFTDETIRADPPGNE
jgi:hypothetical protein